MATATSTPVRSTVEQRLLDRATPLLTDEPNPVGEWAAATEQLYNLVTVVIGDWSQWESDELETRIGESWIEAARAHVQAAGLEAMRTLVVPAMAAAAADYLRQNPPPAHLLAFEGSEVLRGDVAALEAER